MKKLFICLVGFTAAGFQSSAIGAPYKKPKDVNPSLIEVYRDGHLAGHSEKARVGENISLQCAVNQPPLIIQSIYWKFDGITIKDYTPTVGNGHVTYLTDADRSQEKVDVRWVDGGTKLAMCGGFVNDKSFSKITPFAIERPVVNFTAVTSSVNQEANSLRFRYKNSPGIQFYLSFENPKYQTDGSNWGLLQLVNSLRRAKVMPGSIGTHPWWYLPQTKGLDTDRKAFLYPAPGGVKGYRINYTSDMPSQSTFIVRENTPQAEATEIQVADSFEDYFMYKSPKSGSCWVPLSTLSWSWGGNLVKNPDGSYTASNLRNYPNNPVGTPTIQFPEWNHWVDVNTPWKQEVPWP